LLFPIAFFGGTSSFVTVVYDGIVKTKNEVAVALVAMRWSKATPADRARQARVLNRVRRALTAKQRSAIAKKAALARWAKKKGATE
jgi:hypothetical protein